MIIIGFSGLFGCIADASGFPGLGKVFFVTAFVIFIMCVVMVCHDLTGYMRDDVIDDAVRELKSRDLQGTRKEEVGR